MSQIKHSVMSPCFTEPFTAVQFHPHADVHGVIRDGHEAHEASDDGRLQVLEHNVVGVPVPFDHLQARQTPMKEKPPPWAARPEGSRTDGCVKIGSDCRHGLTCSPCRFLHEIQRLPSRLYLILYIWANSLPIPPACRPCVPTRVMKCRERRSIWRNSFRLSGSTVISGHHAPSPSSKSNLGETETPVRTRRRCKDALIPEFQEGSASEGSGWISASPGCH